MQFYLSTHVPKLINQNESDVNNNNREVETKYFDITERTRS